MTARRVRTMIEDRRSGWVPRGLVGPTSDELRSLARDARWAFVELLLAGVHDKAGLMATLSRQFALPNHFGGNWDAFADSLADAVEASDGMIVRLKGLAGLPEELAEPLVEILDAQQAAARGDVDAQHGHVAPRPLVIVADPPLPPHVVA